MKLAPYAITRDMAVEVPLLLWLGVALLLAGLIIAFLGHRPTRSTRPPEEPTTGDGGEPASQDPDTH